MVTLAARCSGRSAHESAADKPIDQDEQPQYDKRFHDEPTVVRNRALVLLYLVVRFTDVGLAAIEGCATHANYCGVSANRLNDMGELPSKEAQHTNTAIGSHCVCNVQPLLLLSLP